jgi:hypothetical protein
MSSQEYINIYLEDGNPQGIKTAENKAKIIKATLVPWELLSKLSDLEYTKQHGIYCLVYDNQELYIGKSDNLHDRLKVQRNNDNLNNCKFVIIFYAKKDEINESHTKYLEYLATEKIKELKQHSLKNTQTIKVNNCTEETKSHCNEYFKSITKLSTILLGYPLFEHMGYYQEKTVRNEIIDNEIDENLFFLKYGTKGRGKVDATMRIDNSTTPKKYIVLKGSTVATQATPSYKQTTRKQLEEEGIIKDNKFTQNYSFNSPSTASGCCMYAASSGNKAWKNKSGTSLEKYQTAKSQK